MWSYLYSLNLVLSRIGYFLWKYKAFPLVLIASIGFGALIGSFVMAMLMIVFVICITLGVILVLFRQYPDFKAWFQTKWPRVYDIIINSGEEKKDEENAKTI